MTVLILLELYEELLHRNIMSCLRISQSLSLSTFLSSLSPTTHFSFLFLLFPCVFLSMTITDSFPRSLSTAVIPQVLAYSMRPALC